MDNKTDKIQSAILYQKILDDIKQISIDYVISLRKELDIMIRQDEIKQEEMNYEETDDKSELADMLSQYDEEKLDYFERYITEDNRLYIIKTDLR